LKGARPLDNAEILLVAQQFDGTFATRNRALFMLGVSVGGRISELLALTIGDVWQNGQPVRDLLFQKKVVKGQERSRMVPVNSDGRRAITDLIEWHRRRYGTLAKTRPLFPSRKAGARLSRIGAHKALAQAFHKAGLNGKLASHSLRKSFAQRIYDVTGDIYAVREVLGHSSVETTKDYLGVSYQKLQRAVETIATTTLSAMPLSSEGNETHKLFLSHLSGNTSAERGEGVERLKDELRRKDQIINRLLQLTQPNENTTDKHPSIADETAEKIVSIASRR